MLGKVRSDKWVGKNFECLEWSNHFLQKTLTKAYASFALVMQGFDRSQRSGAIAWQTNVAPQRRNHATFPSTDLQVSHMPIPRDCFRSLFNLLVHETLPGINRAAAHEQKS